MRITHTPFHSPTRAIGSDYHLTTALLGSLLPKQTIWGKIKQLIKCKTRI